MIERFFDSQVFDAGSELPRDDALGRQHYVRARFEGDRVVRSEVTGPGGIELVNHYDRDWPDEALLELHRASYPGVPARVWSAPRDADHARRERVCVYLDADGAARAQTTEVLDAAGRVLEESTVDLDGVLLHRRRYEYDERGELARAWLFLPDGREILEFDADDD